MWNNNLITNTSSNDLQSQLNKEHKCYIPFRKAHNKVTICNSIANEV